MRKNVNTREYVVYLSTQRVSTQGIMDCIYPMREKRGAYIQRMVNQFPEAKREAKIEKTSQPISPIEARGLEVYTQICPGVQV